MKFKQLPPPPRSNKQIREYIEAVERGRNHYYVKQNGEGWYVRKASDRRGGQLFSTKSEALQVARARAAKKDSQVLVFNRKGDVLVN